MEHGLPRPSKAQGVCFAEKSFFCYNKKIFIECANMKPFLKTLKQFLAVMGIATYLLVSMAVPGVSAEAPKTPAIKQLFPLPDASVYGNLPAPTKGTSATAQFGELVWGIVQNVRYIIGAVAVLMIVYAGLRMVTAYGNEEVYTKQRANIFYAIIGLVVVALGGEMANIFAVSCPPDAFVAPGQPVVGCTQGGFLKDPNAMIRASTIFNQRTKIIITFIKYFVGAVAVLMLVKDGMMLVTQGGNEEKVNQSKKTIIYSIVGLLLIIMSDTVISQVFYKIDLTRYPGIGGALPGMDPTRGVMEIVGFTNLVVTIVGPLAIGALVVGGIMYITAGGQDDKIQKAKRLIVSALVGIIIIYGAFAIVSTFIAGSFGNPPPPDETVTQEVGAGGQTQITL